LRRHIARLAIDDAHLPSMEAGRVVAKRRRTDEQLRELVATDVAGAAATLELDHINGGPRDNRLSNLRILCPNCHAITETWCRRKNGRRTPMQRDQA
jgi:5-methylcytosine-specific restriction endonuclease McrA